MIQYHLQVEEIRIFGHHERRGIRSLPVKVDQAPRG